MYIGGCTLEIHAQNAKMDAAAYKYYTNSTGRWSLVPKQRLLDVVRSDKWDVISLQQDGMHAGMVATNNEDLEYLVKYVNDYCLDAQLVWNRTWAYPDGSPNSGMVNYNYDSELTYQKIVEAVQEKIAPNENFVKIVPSGIAIHNAKLAGLGGDLYNVC